MKYFDAQILIRLRTKDKLRIKKCAQKLGQTVGEYIRRIVLKRVKQMEEENGEKERQSNGTN